MLRLCEDKRSFSGLGLGSLGEGYVGLSNWQKRRLPRCGTAFRSVVTNGINR